MVRRTSFSLFFSIIVLVTLTLYILFNPLNIYSSWAKLRNQFVSMFTTSQSNISLDHDDKVVSNNDIEDVDKVKQGSNNIGYYENNVISNIIDKIEQNINVAARRLDYILVDKNLLINYTAFVLNISKIVTKFAMDIDYSTELNVLMSNNKEFPTEINHIITQLSKYSHDYLSIDYSANHQKSSALEISNSGCTGCIFKIEKYNYNLMQKNFDRQQIIKQLDTFQNYFYNPALLMKFINE